MGSATDNIVAFPVMQFLDDCFEYIVTSDDSMDVTVVLTAIESLLHGIVVLGT